MSCSQCEGIESTFDEESVRKELLFYRRDGADKTTRWLIEAIQEEDIEGSTLLDIGGGIGAIQHALLESGAESAVHVDGSSAYIAGAKEEAEKRGLADRISWQHGDFVEWAQELERTDIVTLDRVICCYDDMPALLGSSLALTGKYLGLVYPRDTWYTRLGIRIIGFFQNLLRHQFRVFVHPADEIEKLIKADGLRQIFNRRTFIWQVAVYAR